MNPAAITRGVTPLMLADDCVPADLAALGAAPRFVEVDPRTLVIDGAYQRELSERSVKLIRRIVAGWSWRSFKPPVVVDVDGLFHVIDGQHTAIAAVTHGGLATIPVMVVEAPEIADRARSFVAHNRDRITITGAQLHFAAVAAGDEDALTIQQVCRRAGVTLLRYMPPKGVFKPGETVALAAIRALVNRYGVIKARQTLEVLVEAKCAPISADLIKATAELLFAPEYAGHVKPADLATLVRGVDNDLMVEARQLSLAKSLPHWRALAIVFFRRRGRGSRSPN